jgi:hypothetical protein
MKITKITTELESRDMTFRWRWKNRIIWILVGMLILSSSLYIERLIHPVICRDLAKDSLIIKMYDTLTTKYKVYSYRDSSLTERNFFEYTKLIGCSHPYETTAQGLYETGKFSKNSSASVNNLFGFKDNEGYISFRHWTNSVDFMVNSYQVRFNLNQSQNYYTWLPKSYHQADRNAYEQGVHYIELNLKQKYK